jgi:rhodanese-related sulfurtransferase
MALAGALEMIPDEPGNIVVVIFPDNIFKYASSIIRHFPELAPPADENGSDSGAPSENELLLAEMIENLKNPYDTIKVKDLSDELAQSEKPLVVDIRIPGDYEASHIPGSANIPQADLGKRLGELPEDRNVPIVTVCNIGKFSKYATLYLKSRGYRNVRSAKGGVNEWIRKGFEVESGSTQTTPADAS